MSKNDGGSAFPIRNVLDDNGLVIDWAQSGMTLRDWFAGQALIGLMAGWESVKLDSGRESGKPSDLASFAFQTADAMLTERNKEESNAND